VKPFWEAKSLAEMTPGEWESLCDGCARCCLIKLEDDSGAVHHTSLSCDLLDRERCRCTRYPQRHELVEDCIRLSPDLAESLQWLPTSCAYRRVAEGRGLASWHPLVSGDLESVHDAGISVRGKTIPESWVHEEEQVAHIIDWVDTR
tara:strand:- start:6590 stop:7030 length:441 start_codon:yes stop_codon:yes gene_type:complete